MGTKLWQEMVLPPREEDLLWELFHENSKLGRFSKGPSRNKVRNRVKQLHESLVFSGHPAINLPRLLANPRLSLTKAISTRKSVRDLMPCKLKLKEAAALLHYSYGMTRDQKGVSSPRSFRAAPSGGALYPLEIFFHTAHIPELKAGLYHYNPSANNVRLLRSQDETNEIAKAIAYPQLARGASLLVFLTAIFERSVFKYGDRGYRFVLLEAGHVAQNLNLVANGLGLGSVNIGGFRDREIDDFLELDGIRHSTIYIIAIGTKNKKGRILKQ